VRPKPHPVEIPSRPEALGVDVVSYCLTKRKIALEIVGWYISQLEDVMTNNKLTRRSNAAMKKELRKKAFTERERARIDATRKVLLTLEKREKAQQRKAA